MGGYELREGLPVITMTVERRRGGVQVEGEPALSAVQGLDYDYLFSEDTLWRLQRPGCTRILPALQALGGKSLFFTSADATAFCSYVLPELGSKLNIVDPERLLLNQIPLEPVVQFYLDAPDSFRIEAHAEFLYGEDKGHAVRAVSGRAFAGCARREPGKAAAGLLSAARCGRQRGSVRHR